MPRLCKQVDLKPAQNRVKLFVILEENGYFSLQIGVDCDAITVECTIFEVMQEMAALRDTMEWRKRDFSHER
jgi:hypothetical protein